MQRVKAGWAVFPMGTAHTPTQPGVDRPRCLFAVTDRRRDGSFERDHVAAGEHTGGTCLHVRSYVDRAVLSKPYAGHILQKRRIRVLTEREDERVGFERLGLAGRLGEAALVELHGFDGQAGPINRLDSAQPVNPDAFLDCFVGFEIMGRHLFPGAAVDDHRFGAQAPCRARGIHRGITTAVDRNAPADFRRLATVFGLLEKLQRVVDRPRITRRDVVSFAQVRANGQEHRVEGSRVFLGHQVFDLVIQNDLHAHRADSCDFAV